MVTWISRLCTLCAISAIAQMLLSKDGGREAIRMICGLLMLHLTCESAAALLAQLTSCTDLAQIFACLMG